MPRPLAARSCSQCQDWSFRMPEEKALCNCRHHGTSVHQTRNINPAHDHVQMWTRGNQLRTFPKTLGTSSEPVAAPPELCNSVGASFPKAAEDAVAYQTVGGQTITADCEAELLPLHTL
ncbi:hypothetical protein DPEC_G00062390 [Dallia pectoralis]|uniref:Uncharacterized protein n=1 Tax=Dallia pectoralis TaxID=75939 RepID=A0ACC2H768_DALPE|nr:hypothetical protein DPEC_G00062390 [Dallia pectoralis]